MSSEIEILSEIEAVRQSPWMYIGSMGSDGAHHLLREVVHNAVDEAILGHCDTIHVHLAGTSCRVEDNGRGIPTETHSQVGISSCEVALTRLHAGSKFRRNTTLFTTGLHGVGLSCVNALSSSLALEVHRGKRRFIQQYDRGFPRHALEEVGVSNEQGTRISFTPDLQIFPDFESFQWDTCRDFLSKLSFLHPNVDFTLSSNEHARTERYKCSQDGLNELLKSRVAQKRILLPEALRFDIDEDGLKFEALATWSTDPNTDILSFVNSVETSHGGTHVNAFRVGLSRALNQTLREFSKTTWSDHPADLEEVCEGLIAVISCRVAEPNFESQSKARFTNTRIVAAVEDACAKQFFAFLETHPQVAQLLVERITQARQARAAAQRVTDRIYLQNARHSFNEEIYKKQFGERSKNWHKSAVWITDEKLLNAHADMCEMNIDAVALDVCCGSGVVGASLKSKVKKIVGLDLTPEMVKLASQRLDEVVQGNVYNLPFADNSFDLVCTREVLHLLPMPEKPVSEIFRVLKPGGQFLVGQILPFSEADGPWMYRIFKKKQPLIYNMFQESDFRKLLLSAGFTNLKMSELHVWESIDVWIDSVETTSLHRHEIRELYREAPLEARAVHPFEIDPAGQIKDLWRWCVFSVRKP